MSAGAALEVERLSVAFRGLQALNGVSVRASAGEITALVGPNGAGKTTLLNAVGGFCAITTGSIRLDGAPIHGLPSHRIAARGVGRAFQFVELFRHMTVLDNLMLGRHLHMRAGLLAGAVFFGRSRREQAAHRARVEAVIEFLELERYRRDAVDSLPFGVQKLCGVARALAMEPRLLVFDEPASGIGAEEEEGLRGLFLLLKSEFSA